MRALLQRVTEARVEVDGRTIGAIGSGMLVLLCAMPGDDEAVAADLARKIGRLRVFRDGEGRMNRSIHDVGGAALVISQFTLAADTSRGNRPGFSGAAAPDMAKALYEKFCDLLRAEGVPVETGAFGTEMVVSLTNDGPVTIWLDTVARQPLPPHMRRCRVPLTIFRDYFGNQRCTTRQAASERGRAPIAGRIRPRWRVWPGN